MGHERPEKVRGKRPSWTHPSSHNQHCDQALPTKHGQCKWMIENTSHTDKQEGRHFLGLSPWVLGWWTPPPDVHAEPEPSFSKG